MEVSLCTLCNERGHHAEKCPEMLSPLRDGFYSGGGGGGGGGGGDDDDEHCDFDKYHTLNKDDRASDRIRRFFIHMDILSNPDCSGVHCDVLQEFQVSSISHKIRC